MNHAGIKLDRMSSTKVWQFDLMDPEAERWAVHVMWAALFICFHGIWKVFHDDMEWKHCMRMIWGMKRRLTLEAMKIRTCRACHRCTAAQDMSASRTGPGTSEETRSLSTPFSVTSVSLNNYLHYVKSFFLKIFTFHITPVNTAVNFLHLHTKRADHIMWTALLSAFWFF